jgi:pyrroline-5-carboxylate reductase
MNSIAIIGCGNIGISIAEGLIAADKKTAKTLIATRRNAAALGSLKEKGVTVTTDNRHAVSKASLVILAVKPYLVKEVLEEIAPVIKKDHLVISVASSISMDEMKAVLKKDVALFRVMPNTAASIGGSITCISSKGASPKQQKEVEALFRIIGETVLIDESLMEAATILGACGIAYVLRFIRAMIQGGIQIGFDAETATKITTQTVRGAAELLIHNNSHPEREIDKVTTPKGCTITGLNEMEHKGFSSSLIHGIVKSFDKIEK